MLTLSILIWFVLPALCAPSWCYVCAGIAFCLKVVGLVANIVNAIVNHEIKW